MRHGHPRVQGEALKDDRHARVEAALRLAGLYARRPEQSWSVRRFREHARDVHDVGELLALADREMVAPLDREARRCITRAAKRVATVTAMSPMALIAVGYVLIENLRLLRLLAALYGGRPGFLGVLRLAHLVFAHLLATGGVALTDDLLGQSTEVLDKEDPQADGDRPELAEGQRLHALVGGYQATKTLRVEAAVGVGDVGPRDAEDPWVPLEVAALQLRQLAVVVGRQIVTDLAKLLLDDVEVVDKPFRGRRDRSFFLDRVSQILGILAGEARPERAYADAALAVAVGA